MSVERQVRLAVLEAACGRILAETVGIGARLALALGRGLDDLSDGFFYFELDAGRRYKTLTGNDLGEGAGDKTRHAFVSENLFEDDEEE